MRTEFLCISVLRIALGPRVKLARCKSVLTVIVALPGLSLTFFDIVKRLFLETYYGGHIIPVIAWQFRARANGAITDHRCLKVV